MHFTCSELQATAFSHVVVTAMQTIGNVLFTHITHTSRLTPHLIACT